MLEREASAYSLLKLLNAKLAYMPCMRTEVRLPFYQNVACVMIVVEKCIMLDQVVALLAISTALKQDTFGAYEQSYTFAQPAV